MQGVSNLVVSMNTMSSESTNPDSLPLAPSVNKQAIPLRPSNRVVRATVTVVLLVVSFCVITSLGCEMLYLGWRRDSLYLAVWRCAGFVLLIAVAHRIGYRLWQKQFEHGQDGGVRVLSRCISAVYWRPLRTALIQQNIVIILASLTLDMGQTISVTTIAIAAYWLTVGVVVFRRPSSPTEGDIDLVRYGFLLILCAVGIAGPIIAFGLGRW